MHYARIAATSLVLVFAAAMLAIPAAAQTATAPDQPDAMDLLKSVELAYGAMNTYSAKVTESMAMDGSAAQEKMNMETPMTVTVDASGKFRVETKGMIGMVMVNDGTTMWMYMPMANSYSKFPANSSYAVHGGRGAGMFGSAQAPLEYKSVILGVKDAKIVRSEKLRVNDADADCWVVSVDYGAPGSETNAAAQAASGISFKDLSHTRMLWVDKSSYLVYEDDSTTKMIMGNANTPTTMKRTSKIDSVTVNGPVSPDVFTFTPPAGAKEMDESKFMPKNGQAPQTQN